MARTTESTRAVVTIANETVSSVARCVREVHLAATPATSRRIGMTAEMGPSAVTTVFARVTERVRSKCSRWVPA